MTEILSQTEIDALLQALSSGEMDVEQLKKEEEEKRVRVYDFKRALRFSKDQIRSLTRIHENFARLLTTQFSAQLRTYMQITVASVDQLPYEEFIRSIPKTTTLGIFSASPLKGRFVMEMNPVIAYAMLERHMGGQDLRPSKAGEMTEIELAIIERIFRKSLESFQEAWLSMIELEVELETLETNPQFMQIVSPNETVAVISFTTKIGDITGMINLCLPHVVLEPLMPKLTAHYWMKEKQKEADPANAERIRQSIQQMQVLIRTILGTSTISIGDFLHLSKGDVIRLEQEIDDPLLVMLGERKKFIARAGQVGGRIAVQVEEIVKEGDEENGR